MKKKYHVLITNVFGLLGVKALAMCVSLSIIPYYLVFFSDDKTVMGEWLAFFSLLMVFFALDFGVGSRLKNDLIAALNKPEDKSLLIIKGALANFIVSVLLLLISFLAYALYQYLSVDGNDYVIDDSSIIVGVAYILLFSPLRVIIPILQSEQKNWLSGFILITPQLYILIYLLVMTIPSSEFVFLELVLLLCISTLATYIFFIIRHCKKINFNHNKIKFSLSFFWDSIDYSKKSSVFFLIQISIIFLFSSNEIFYYLIGAPDEIVHYQYYYRVYSIVFVGFAAISMPFWSAIREAYVLSDIVAVKKLFLILSLLIIPVLVFVVLLSVNYQSVIDLWLGKGVYAIDSTLVCLFAVFSILMCAMYACSAMLNSFDVVKYQALTLVVACIVKFVAVCVIQDSSLDPIVASSVISLIFVVICLTYKSTNLIRSI